MVYIIIKGMKRRKLLILCLVFLLSTIVSVSIFKYLNYISKKETLSLILVDKINLKMKLINLFGDTINIFPIAVGTNRGDKIKIGDLKTPEGTFPVDSIENSSTWKYDFEGDEKGPVDGAYGPWFIRLKIAAHKGIGIHGTHDNSTIGKRVSHGCIRMKNEDLVELVKIVKKGTQVIITKDSVVDEVKEKKKAK